MTDWPDDWFRGGQPGGAAQPAAAQPAAGQPGGAEPTMQLPTRTAGPDQPGGSAVPPYWPDQPPPGTGGRPPRPPRARIGGFAPTGWRRWLRPRPILAVLAVLLSLALIAAIGGYFYFDSKLTRVNALVPSAATAGQNWLITGSTGHLTHHQIVRYHAGFNFDTLSDTILVLHIPGNGGRPTLLSIPRDSYVNIPGHGMNKINASYAFGGPTLLVRTVQAATGLHISHFIQIGYAGLVKVVNAVGGVRLCLPGPVVDRKAGIHLRKGCQNLNGRQALGFVRTRQFALGDLQRVQDQRILIKALLRKMTSLGTLLNPFAVIPAASGSVAAVEVDQGTNLYQLIHVAFALRNPVTTTVPFGGFASNAAGSVVLWDTARADRLFYDLAHDVPLPKSLITGSKSSATA
jgi:LCP family protein required for cell wall assembly